MPLRFHRSIRLMPGVHLNLGLHGAGLSVGPRGLHVGVNRRGMYTSAGIPGTGMYAVHHIRSSAQQHPNVAGTATGCILVGVLVAELTYCGVMLTRRDCIYSHFLVIATGKFVERDRGHDGSICGEGAGSSGHWI